MNTQQIELLKINIKNHIDTRQAMIDRFTKELEDYKKIQRYVNTRLKRGKWDRITSFGDLKNDRYYILKRRPDPNTTVPQDPCVARWVIGKGWVIVAGNFPMENGNTLEILK